MRPVFLATLGQRPEAITVALDKLLLNYDYETIGIIHTDPEKSEIQLALSRLQLVLAHDYSGRLVEYYEVLDNDGYGLVDIETTADAQTYYRYLIQTIISYREQRIPIHLLVAGGRKSMTIYATLAATLLFGIHDHVLTVLSPMDVVEAHQFHVPDEILRDIQIVELPTQKSRLLPSSLADKDVDFLLDYRVDPRHDFLKSLTPRETVIVEALQHYRDTSVETIAEDILRKKHSTVEGQLTGIYRKLESYFDIDLKSKKKREKLVEVLDGRI